MEWRMPRGLGLWAVMMIGVHMGGSAPASAEPHPRTAPGGIRLLAYLPAAEVLAEDSFWRNLLGLLTRCEEAADPMAENQPITPGSGCAPPAAKDALPPAVPGA